MSESLKIVLAQAAITLLIALFLLFRRRYPGIFFAFAVFVFCASWACFITAVALFDKVTWPDDFLTRPQPGGVGGLFIGAGIGLVFMTYPAGLTQRVGRIESRVLQAGAKNALLVLSSVIFLFFFVAGALIGSMLVRELSLL